MRHVTTALEIGGLASVTYGIALWSVPAAFVVGGLAAIAASYGVTFGWLR